MRIAEFVHRRYVAEPRARMLSSHLAKLIPRDVYVLDIGCGDGLITRLITRPRPDLSVRGIDVLVRDKTWIPVESFDGRPIPFGNTSFDTVILVDVLPHADDAVGLLSEAIRVSRHTVLIKDHTVEGFLAGPAFRFKDRTGNLHHGVSLPYEYWPRQRWNKTFESVGVKVIKWKHYLGLCSWPARWIFDRSLHFVLRLMWNELRLMEK